MQAAREDEKWRWESEVAKESRVRMEMRNEGEEEVIETKTGRQMEED